MLQLRGQQSAQTFMRVNVNTFFGVGGFLDVASEAGIERHREDFGQTLGRWGVGPGPYLVLPILGPSTVRDTAALPVDYVGGLISNVDNIPLRNSMYALRLVDARADLLKVDRLLRRRGARQVFAHARRFPAAPAQRRLRRQPAGRRIKGVRGGARLHPYGNLAHRIAPKVAGTSMPIQKELFTS